MQPQVSIIIPVYNAEKYLDRCVQSVVDQTYRNLEIVLVDDGSPDRCPQMCDDWARKDARIRAVHQANKGSAATRNLGVSMASGEFIAFVDSDDWIDPRAVELLIKKQQESDADIVTGKILLHYPDKEELIVEKDYDDKEEMLLKMVELTLDHTLCKRLIRTSLYIENGIQCVEGVNIGEDHHTLPRLIYYAKKCVCIDDIVYHYNRCNINSYTHVNSYTQLLNKACSDLKSTEILIDFFKDKNDRILKHVQEVKAVVCADMINLTCSAGDSAGYNRFARKLFATDTDILASIGLNGWRRFVRKKYWHFRLYLRLRKLL